MAIAPVLKTGVRKDLWVRIPHPPLPAQCRAAHHPVVRNRRHLATLVARGEIAGSRHALRTEETWPRG
jgi:hypothetical protein